MDNAKKRISVAVLLAVILIAAAVLLAACGDGAHTVRFMIQNDDGQWQEMSGSPLTSENGMVTMPANPSKDDYVFRGWYEDENFSTEFVNENISEDKTLYAYFVPVLVDIHLNSADAQEKRLEELEVLTEQYREEALSMGLTFDGWYTNAACTENYDGESDDVTDLYGRYMANVSYHNGYEEVAKQNVAIGTTTQAPSPEDIAHDFPYMDAEDMYFVDSEGNRVDFSTYTFSTNTQLTVMWKSPYIKCQPIDGAPGCYWAEFKVNDIDANAGNWPAISFLSEDVTVDDQGTKGDVKVVVEDGTTMNLPNVKKMFFADGIEYIRGFNGAHNSTAEEIKLPSTLTVLENAFGSHPELKGVTLPDGLRVIIDSFWANDFQNDSAQIDATAEWVDKVGYDFDITVPDSVVNLSAVPTNLVFGENSAFTKEGDGDNAVIWKDNGDGTKTLVAYYGTENGNMSIPEGYEYLQVGLTHDMDIKNMFIPAGVLGVKYNEVKGAIDESGNAVYPYYTGGLLYIESTTVNAGNAKGYAVVERLERMSYVVVEQSSLPADMSPYTIVGRHTGNSEGAFPYTDEAFTGKIVFAPSVEEGGEITVTVKATNDITQKTDIVIITLTSGQALTQEQLINEISSQLEIDKEISILSCTQFGADYAYEPADRNQYLDVIFSYEVGGFLYELTDDGSGYIVTEYDESSAASTGSGRIVVIPSVIEGIPVVEIADSAFENAQSLYMVYIGSNVKKIGERAFANTPYLSSVQVTPGSLEVIGRSAFENAGTTVNAETGEVTVNNDLKIQIPLAKLTDIQPYAFKTKALTGFTPVAGEENRTTHYSLITVQTPTVNSDLQVGQYYYDLYMMSGSTDYIAILKYTGQTTGKKLNDDGTVNEDSAEYQVYDFDYVAVAAGYARANGMRYNVEFGRSFVEYSSTITADWVLRYKVLEGSVYYIDESWGEIIFGIVSEVEENALTDIADEVKINYHDKSGDCWISGDTLKQCDPEVFADGWFNGVKKADTEAYAELTAKLAEAKGNNSTLMGWVQW